MQGKVVIGTELDTKKFDAQIEDVKRNLNDIEAILSDTKGMDADEIMKYNAEAERLRNKLADMVKKKQELDNPPSQLAEWSKDFGKSLKDSVARVGKLVIGIFGIRTAYNAVRNAMSVITSNDEQLKADIDYMKNVLAYMLEPVVRAIVGWFKQLMFYVGYIAKAWFGVDIYAKASQKAMNSMADSSGSMADNLKDAKKQLAGFDEMNVMQDTSRGSGGGAGGGATMPSFDLSSMQGEVPGWLRWIAENGDLVGSILLGIASGLVAIKLGADLVTATGIGLVVTGIALAIINIIQYLNDPSWENFGQIITGIGIAIAGLGVLIFGLPGIIAGVAIAILGLVISNWETIKAFLVEKIEWLASRGDWIREHLGDTVGDIYDNIITILKKVVIDLDTKFKAMKGMFDGLIQFVQGVFSGNWKKAWDGIRKIFENWWTGLKSFISTIFTILAGMVVNVATNIGSMIGDAIKGVVNSILNSIERNINDAISLINSAIKVINKIPGVDIGRVGRVSLPRLAQGGIVNNPGQGVMMGSYIAGERGAEAVLPLTDDTLQRLANMIPITVNLTNTMNGRVISRELKKVQNETDFAFNG